MQTVLVDADHSISLIQYAQSVGTINFNMGTEVELIDNMPVHDALVLVALSYFINEMGAEVGDVVHSDTLGTHIIGRDHMDLYLEMESYGKESVH